MRRGILVAALIAPLAASACIRTQVPLSIHETKTFAVAAGKLVRLDVRSLDVEVQVAPGNAITAQVEIDARSSSRGAANRWVESHTPVFEDSPSALEIRQPSRRTGIVIFGYLNAKARVKLVMPPECRLEVRTSSGDVSVSGDSVVAGPVRVRTSSGDVTVTGGLRELIVKTSSGDVRVRHQALTALEADTTSGDVTLESGCQRAIVGTSSGDVRLEQLQGGLSADTSSGEVAASWATLAPGANVRVRTTSGDVRLRVPETAQLRGRISTSSGSIHSDFSGTSERRERELSFAATGDAVEIEVHTSSGDVSVHKHP
ncbi:MAG: DUF4097 domain-containing protein [Acidobacteriia bacterium]|nr:DUF4097 domain-containing protein [Terriglobia bacterium]